MKQKSLYLTIITNITRQNEFHVDFFFQTPIFRAYHFLSKEFQPELQPIWLIAGLHDPYERFLHAIIRVQRVRIRWLGAFVCIYWREHVHNMTGVCVRRSVVVEDLEKKRSNEVIISRSVGNPDNGCI